MKSKKILLNIKHFYKINSKFDIMRNYTPLSKQVLVNQRLWLSQVDNSVKSMESGFTKVKQKSIQTDPFQSISRKTCNRWVQTSVSRS